MREQLSLIEPFHTAIELATRRTGVSIAEIVEGLDRKGIRWHESDEEINLAIVHNLLVRWSIIGNLLTYDGRTAKFKKVMIDQFVEPETLSSKSRNRDKISHA